MWYFYPTEGWSLNFLICRETPPPTPVPSLSGIFWSPLRKTVTVVGLLTVMIFFQSKKYTACNIKDEKDETIFSFFDDVESTEDYPSTWK